jgi:hypothetical protein
VASDSDDIGELLGEHVPGPDGYRFGPIEHRSGDAVRVQIVDARGDEVAWAAGITKHEVLRDARQKTAAHAAGRAGRA